MYTVLVCDDEKDIVSALKIYLTSDGYDVLCAYNGDEALELMEHNTVHLVLMDIMMPKTDGLTALSLLREKYNTRTITEMSHRKRQICRVPRPARNTANPSPIAAVYSNHASQKSGVSTRLPRHCASTTQIRSSSSRRA